jgi:protein-disulfide isomerase
VDIPLRKASIRAMLRFAVLSLVTVTALVGCDQDSKDPDWKKPKARKADRKELPAAKQEQKVAETPAAPAGSVEERLQRVERRLEKITSFLRQAVPPKLDESVAYAVPIDPADPVVGPKDAKVTIVEAYEFLCPYCAMVAPTMDQLVAEYPKDVRVVSKYFLIHGEPAMPSGQGACAAAKQGKYDAFQKALWKKAWPTPQSPNREALTADGVTQLATSLGMDGAKFKADMEGDCKEWVSRSMKTLQQFGAGGTPSFYVNGRFVQAGNPAAFKRVIDEEMAKVEESGVAPGEYYEKVVVGQGEQEARMVSPFDE